MRIVAFLVVIVVAVASASHFAFQLSRAGQPQFVLFLGLPTVILAMIGVFRAHRDGVLYRRASFDEAGTGAGWLNVRAGDFTRGFVAAAFLFLASWAVSKLVAPVGSDRESWLARLYLQLGDPAALRGHVLVVVAVIVVMAIAEELVWRGLVTSLLEELVGSRRAWVWAAVLYALAHAPTIWALADPVAGPNPALVSAMLFAGLVWGFMARRFERLWPSMISHALFDWAVLMMFRLWGPSI